MTIKRLSVMIVIILMIGVCGCMKANKNNGMVERMVSYMNEKYDDEFSYVTVFGGTPLTKVHKIFVSSQKYPDKRITVICDARKTEEVYSDNYIAFVYEAETRELITSIISRCFSSEYFISYSVDTTATGMKSSKDTTFEEYISDPRSCIHFMAVVKLDMKEADKEAKIDELERAITDSGLCCSGKVYIGNAIDSIPELNDENYYRMCLKDKLYDHCLYFNMVSNNEFVKAEWEAK